jgi:hypothetical protein
MGGYSPMRSLIGFGLALLLATVLSAQNRSGFVNTPGVTRGFGSVVFPGGTSALPGIQRTTGSVVYPAGGGPQIGVPGIPLQTPLMNSFGRQGLGGRPGIGGPAQGGFGWTGGGGRRNGNRNNNNNNRNNTVVYAYPVYVGGGGYYGGDAYDNGYAAQALQPEGQQQQQPNILVIYPPSTATPMTLYPSETAPGGPPSSGPSSSLYPAPAPESAAGEEATHYLIAFKDHTIYSAIAYWVDGDTLHYFTSGNTHNQASLSLVDRALTEKLNKDSGLEVKLPPVK